MDYSNSNSFPLIFLGSGSYLPQHVIKNIDLPAHLDTSDEWIRTRSGITQRHKSSSEETTSFMATQSLIKALDHAKIKATDLDAIIVATTTADHTFPSTAARVQANVKADKAFVFDIQAACSGFVYAYSMAENMVISGQAKHIAIIGAEHMTKIVDWNDRGTCVLFGDGAGAIIVSSNNQSNVNEKIKATSYLFSDGCGYDKLYVDPTIKTPEEKGAIVMDGKEIFKKAILKMGQAIEVVLEKNNISIEDIDYIIPHQANARIIKGIADRFNLPSEKVIVTVDVHANTSAASIPLALDVSLKNRTLKNNSTVLIVGMGAGITWGASLLRI
ncbi:MAG: 3-oxoacyl-ACP synthase [Candidatus Puniceispirillum sp.]|nr:3-oxoacyl-ACP synthase [Candidatus Pelagibacter sp.]MBA4283141.1 3-oxoacyl-ACP synthase [Candidatus Puniceispirillum sp.]